MRTHLTTNPSEAARYINNGEIVGFPTETVYGLGADVFNEDAVVKIFQAKKRPDDNPLIVHIYSLSQLDEIANDVNECAKRIVDHFFPGAITIIVKKSKRVPYIVSAGLETIGIRMPSLSITSEFLSYCKNPVAAPSANLSGKPSGTSWEDVLYDFNGIIPCIFQGEKSTIGIESTVIDTTSTPPLILRTGAITIEELKKVIPTIQYYNETKNKPKSPGVKYKHYSPNAKVALVKYSNELILEEGEGYIGLSSPAIIKSNPSNICICRSLNEYVHHLYGFFRECDLNGMHKIYCEMVEENDIGIALMNRLIKASGKIN